MDTAGSFSFVDQNGTVLEKARLMCILYGTRPGKVVVRSLTDLQNDDGGFPFGLVQGNPASLNSTHVALLWMDELGMLGSPEARRAFEYILRVQRDDGGWDEDASIAGLHPPPWAIPGEPRARVFLSAQSAFWLAGGGYCGHPGFRHALDFLLGNQDASGRFLGFLHSNWIASGALFMAGPEYSESAALGLEALKARPLPEWVDSQISWALDCLSRAGLPKDEPFIAEGLAELGKRQKTDGKWVSEDGEAWTAGTVIEVLKVMKRYGLVT
jgi:hypothetical protein